MKPVKQQNIKLVIEYDGTDFSGWQRLPAKRTVQGTIESVLTNILNTPTTLTGAGRTDAGVHAYGQTANFMLKNEFDLVKLRRALNGLLPEDIAIREISKVKPGFSSRFDAKMKTYTYVVLNSSIPSALQARYSYFYPRVLKVSMIKKAAKGLLGRHDFKHFSSGEEREKTVRSVKAIKITKKGNYISMDFTGRSFLRRMVRIMAGLLVDAGAGAIRPADTGKIVRGKMKFSPKALPPRGLFLKEIKY
ncbi:MAG: tRNA pseudouridine(38-40) synthase TruA [Candidatus Firestonebacteria bacterium]